MQALSIRSLFLFALMGFMAATVRAEESPLAQYYGFKPVEVFKLAERSGNMLTGDLNHDGLTDLILGNFPLIMTWRR